MIEIYQTPLEERYLGEMNIIAADANGHTMILTVPILGISNFTI